MLMRSRSHSNVRVPLMVMVMIVSGLHQVCGTDGRTGGNEASLILQKLRRDQDDWLASPPFNVRKPVERTESLFQQLEEFDRLDDTKESAPAKDIESIWGFGLKSSPAQRLEEKPKETRLNYLLNYSSAKEVPMGPAMKHESAQQREQLEQRHRQMEHFKNAAADLAFERMMNMQRERTEGAKSVFLPLFSAAKPSGAGPLAKPVPAKPSNGKFHPMFSAEKPPAAWPSLAKPVAAKHPIGKIFPLFPAANPSGARPSWVKTVPAKPTNGKMPPPWSPASPRPGTCPATTFRPPTTTKPRFGDSAKSKPKPSQPQKGPPKPLTPPSRAKCKHGKQKKKKPQVSASSAMRLEQMILAMKQHALSILKNLNYLEMEVLSQSPNTCSRHQSKGKGNGAIPKKKTKTGERLDRPTQPSRAQSKLHRGFFFGIRPANAKERLTDLAAAREEELKLRGKVWREHLQRLMARKRPFFKPKRYEEAPAAAARLEPVEPKSAVDTQLNLKSLSMLLKSRPTSAPSQSVEDPAGRMPVSSGINPIQAKQLKTTEHHPTRRRKKKKKMMLALRPTDNQMRG
ncbi:protein piccolo [Drosophila obscura]|uniref:protein piccolo n=1 Tax=Drosophila obscura TaxID=7282 RepID=UPI001BB0E98F|nr:protein piccolo [Drosophila obscura]